MEILPSKLAQSILQLKGKPLDLSEYKPFEVVYDCAPYTLTLCAGRQVGKSVSLAASITSNSILRSHFSTLFVSPLSQQTSRFSSQYLAPFLASPIVKNHFVDSSSIKNVFSRTLNNGSSITLGYAEDESSADRIRGVAADMLLIDEVQDVSMDAVPILAETLSASPHAFKRYTGTAKGESNTLALLFKRSNGMEWVVKCTSCNRHSIPNDFDACLKMATANPMGPGCFHCGHLLDMKTGRWLAARPSIKNDIGMHIGQLIIPARTTPRKWGELVGKVNTYDKIKLSNEVFGLPVGAGGRPLSISQCMAICNPNRKAFDIGFPFDSRNILYTVMGVDWSVTGGITNGKITYTVATVLGFDFQGKAYLLYAKKFEGIDILEQVRRIEEIFHQYKCNHLASDRGVGHMQGQTMRRDLGEDKVSMINYVAAKTNLRYDKLGEFFAADRTLAIDTAITKVKMGPDKIEMPCWDIMHPFMEDFLALYEEESLSGRRLYRKDEDRPDDFAHSIVFALIARMIQSGEFVYQDKDSVITNTLETFDF